MKHLYILNGQTPVPIEDIIEWGEWLETADRRVAYDTIRDCRVSTVFLGINHGGDDHRPMLFETLVWGGKLDGKGRRYSTWSEAETGHQDFVESVKYLYDDSQIPVGIRSFCREHNYTEPFLQEGMWWAYPPNAVIPVSI